VLAGVGLSAILHVVPQSNQLTIERWWLDADGRLIETGLPGHLAAPRWVKTTRLKSTGQRGGQAGLFLALCLKKGITRRSPSATVTGS
jgi:hypothetical protein